MCIGGLVALSAAVIFWLSPGISTPTDSYHVSRLSESDSGNPAKFVGHQKCFACHAEIHQSHLSTPHAFTMTPTSQSAAAQGLCNKLHFGGEGYGKFHYECDSEGLMVSLPERFSEKSFPLDYAFGSGKHAVTFLTLLRDGAETVSIEHRLSWFTGVADLAITPGQQNETPTRDVECFGKVFRGDDMHRCVGCHVTTGRIVDGGIEDLTPGVHCERCHGPGSTHVEAAEAGRLAESLLAIRRHWSASEEVAMCGECHRMPAEIDPVRLRAYPKSLIRFQPVGLLQSRCYLASDGAMKCTTCHDAHRDVNARTSEMQIDTCRNCHSSPTQVECGHGATDKCIGCHMPPIELLPGISFHDHWIRIRKGPDLHPEAGSVGSIPDSHSVGSVISN
jgi:hypothetical protein